MQHQEFSASCFVSKQSIFTSRKSNSISLANWNAVNSMHVNSLRTNQYLRASKQGLAAKATPNPSLKASANSVPSGPRGATSFILLRAGLPSHCWRRLSSNVRPRKRHSACELVWVNQGRWHAKLNCGEGCFPLHQKPGFSMFLPTVHANPHSHGLTFAKSGTRTCAHS
jgi:hypothetical protein